MTLGGPVFEDGCELMIGNDDVFVNLSCLVQILNQPIEDGFLTYFQ